MLCLHLSPGIPLFQLRIEDGEQLAHADGERDRHGFASSLQALIAGVEYRIEPEK